MSNDDIFYSGLTVGFLVGLACWFIGASLAEGSKVGEGYLTQGGSVYSVKLIYDTREEKARVLRELKEGGK